MMWGRICICPHPEFWCISGLRMSNQWLRSLRKPPVFLCPSPGQYSFLTGLTRVSERSGSSWAHTSCLSCDFPSEFYTSSSTFLRGARACVLRKASCFSQSLPCFKARLNQSGGKLFQIRPIILHGRFHRRESRHSRTHLKNNQRMDDSKQDNSGQLRPVSLPRLECLDLA